MWPADFAVAESTEKRAASAPANSSAAMQGPVTIISPEISRAASSAVS